MEMKLEAILEKSLYEAPGYDEALFLMTECADNAENAQKLFDTACAVRDKELGRAFRWRTGIGSICSCDLKPHCRYCNHWHVGGKMRIIPKEAVERKLDIIHRLNIKRVYLVGGITDDYNEVFTTLGYVHDYADKDIFFNINVGASVPIELLGEVKRLGVSRVDSVFETFNPEVFKKYKPGDSREKKMRLAENLGDAGLLLGTGMMAGLGPRETRLKDYVDLFFYLKQFDYLDNLYVSKFYPYPGIPMDGYERCSALEGACVIAVARLVLRHITISGANGWKDDDDPTPLKAGGGNQVMAYSMRGEEADCDIDELVRRFAAEMEETKAKYASLGFDVIS